MFIFIIFYSKEERWAVSKTGIDIYEKEGSEKEITMFDHKLSVSKGKLLYLVEFNYYLIYIWEIKCYS